MDPAKRHPKYKRYSEEQCTLMLWGRCARFARLLRTDCAFLVKEERAMIRRLGEARRAETVLKELRGDPQFEVFEQEEQARAERLDEQVGALPLEQALDLEVLTDLTVDSYRQQPRRRPLRATEHEGGKTRP